MLHEQHEKINEAKLQFFTNISHEIRTPLTLIAGPLEKLMKENEDKEIACSYKLMYKNTQRLLRLVNQLLDVRKIDRGQLQISFVQNDLVAFIKDIKQTFDYLAEKKEIKFTFTYSINVLKVWFDPNNFDKVLYNVLSNAFKFTPNMGVININLEIAQVEDKNYTQKEFAKISVANTGPGIAPENLERIFDRFFQIDNKQNSNTGTGIGLHLSRSLIELQHGRIYAENRVDTTGSIFHILIPIGSDHIQPIDAIQQTPEPTSIEGKAKTLEYLESLIPETDEESKAKTTKKAKYSVLVAEDDPQMLKYLEDELSNHYKTILCNNGREALDSVNKHNPDLIISDVMMPVMDGIELCKKLKSNPATTHLPIILLTAKSRDEDKAEGLDIGADAYLVKPFSTDLLIKNIKNLLLNRERINIKVHMGDQLNAKKSNISSADKKLIEKILEIIEERIGDQMFNSEELSKSIGMSRVHLFRKMKKLTGQSPSDFIRRIRLQRAAHLIEGNAGFIKEIAFQTGFTSFSHFSRSFLEFHGVSPSEYLNSKKENNLKIS